MPENDDRPKYSVWQAAKDALKSTVLNRDMPKYQRTEEEEQAKVQKEIALARLKNNVEQKVMPVALRVEQRLPEFIQKRIAITPYGATEPDVVADQVVDLDAEQTTPAHGAAEQAKAALDTLKKALKGEKQIKVYGR